MVWHENDLPHVLDFDSQSPRIPLSLNLPPSFPTVFHQCRRSTCPRPWLVSKVFSWGFPRRAIPGRELKQRGFSPGTFGFGPTYSFALSTRWLVFLLVVLFMRKGRIKRTAENAGIEFFVSRWCGNTGCSPKPNVGVWFNFSRLEKYLFVLTRNFNELSPFNIWRSAKSNLIYSYLYIIKLLKKFIVLPMVNSKTLYWHVSTTFLRCL